MFKKSVLNYGLLAGILLFLGACQSGGKRLFPETQEIFGLASPIRLSAESVSISLFEYFSREAIDKIDSISLDASFNAEFNKSAGNISLRQSPESPAVSLLNIWIGKAAYSIPLYKSRKIHYTFQFDGKGKKYKTVQMAGQVNDWTPSATNLTEENGIWSTTFFLAPGRYHYQMVLDGKWVVDPNNPEIVDNNIGGFNSLLAIEGQDASKAPFLITSGFKNDDITIDITGHASSLMVLWQNHPLPQSHVYRHGAHVHIKIPADARKTERSYLRIYACNEHGASNDLLIPLHKGQVLTSSEQLSRFDREASILYFLMVDRFNNGNKKNDQPIQDPLVLPPANYQGGDLAGITERINDGYFEKLGINTIWLSPITQNPLEAYVEFPAPNRKYSGYHGYWPITLTTIDHRFGTEAEMDELVQTAHKNGISVLLDFVSNHVHINNPLIKDNPQWATELNLPDGRKNIRLWDEQRLTTWFDTFLPSLDFSKPEVVEVMSDSALFWIQRFNLDGFRHDATKHIPTVFWQSLTSKLKQEVMIPQNRRLFQIGETFGSRELIGSYVGSGLLDGQFDFNLYFDSRSIFAVDEASFTDMATSLQESFAYYGYQHMMGNITGNHDLPRFISLAGGDLRFDEDSQAAAWDRVVGVGNDNAYMKLSSLTAFIMTIPGVPVIYYGDEIGLPGAGDPDSRRMMKFDALTEKENAVKERAAMLTRLRSNRLEMVYGNFKNLHLSPQTWAYSRSFFNAHSIVVFNKSSEPKNLSIELPSYIKANAFSSYFGHEFSLENNKINITVAPYAFEVLTSK